MTRSQLDAGSDGESTRRDPTGPATARDPSRLASGSLLAGKYRLELPLGQGGMGVVWSAYHLQLEIPVAIKLLRGHDPGHARRLKLEARAAARLVHPAIVRTLDVAATDEREPFIVMELLTGETLASALGRGHISALRAVQLLLPIAEALSFAHEHGVVHRDLKPENVFLAVEGDVLQPKLLDFGIAKLSCGPAVRLTASGVALGSPSYMSPEQARGEEVDHLSDVWTFCVLLYKAVGGKAPFRGSNAHDIIEAILHQDAPPLPLGAGVDAHLAAIVLGGLNKEPAGRPPCMRKLGQQLARWLLLHGVSVDASGASLVGKWLGSDAPARPRASDAPPRAQRAPVQEVVGEVAVTLPGPARSALPASVQGPKSSRKLGLPRPTRLRWALWALAGMLVAGVSLGLTSANDSPRNRTPARSPVVASEASLLAAKDPELSAADAPLEQPLPQNDVDASTGTEPAISPAAAPPTVPPSLGVPRPAAQPRAKSSASAPRTTLPF